MPRISLTPPGDSLQQQLLNDWQQAPYSYAEVEATKGHFPPGYDHDHNQILLGKGAETFTAAKEALKAWHMFPANWTRIDPYSLDFEPDKVVIMSFRLFGLWWANGCRIVYTRDEDRAFGFAYGTLTSHVESGEEIFWIEWKENDEVWYRLEAFSKPQFWLTRLTYPFPRIFQKKFARQSKERMFASTQAFLGQRV